ncbi:MAG: hypothetical protein ABSF96_05365 [Steroidobacteraceae bacterium]|jgi:hypothetical protein
MPGLVVEERFCGPPGCANGGYAAGLIMRHAAERLSVRLERPIPLHTQLELRSEPEGVLELLHAGQVLARAWPAALQLDVPAAPSYLEALEASRQFAGFARHAYPGCFVCGPQRRRGDGLRIFAGRLGGAGLVAAPWIADASLADGTGKVRAEFMSAALDCPGYFAARSDAAPMLLGQFTAHIDRCVHIDEPCVVIGWKLECSGRKYEVGTALFDEDGEQCARARAVWIEPRAAM